MSTISYLDLDGNQAEGIVWCPGPRPSSVWVLPREGAPSHEAVVVKLPGGKRTHHQQIEYIPFSPVAWGWNLEDDTRFVSQREAQVKRLVARHAPKLEPKDWLPLVEVTP